MVLTACEEKSPSRSAVRETPPAQLAEEPRPSPADPEIPEIPEIPEAGPLVSESTVKAWLERTNREEPPVALSEGGQTLVVAPGGSDENPGSSERPFASIGRALQQARPGDRILVRAGTYAELVTFPRSGEPGRPIVLEGERGPDGEWLTVIDPGQRLTGWTPAPEVGEGIFRLETNGVDPYCLTLDGKQILRVHDRLMALPGPGRKAGEPYQTIQIGGFADFEKAGVSGLSFLSIPPDGLVREMKEAEGSLPFWNGIEALYGVWDGVVFLRFRDGRSPEPLDLRAAPAATALTVANQSHLVIRHLAIQGAEKGLVLEGAGATDNVIEQNAFRNGLWRVVITKGAGNNLVRQNHITLGFFGSEDFGAWGGTHQELQGNVKSQIRMMLYRAFKHLSGTDASADIGVRVTAAGPGNRIIGNRIFGGLKGIHAMSTPDLTIQGNAVHNMSSVGMVTLPDLWNVRVHDNLFFDCNIILRIHQYNSPSRRSEFHFRNVFVQPQSEGTHVYMHYNDFGAEFGPDQEPDIGIYQNTFIGGKRGLVCGSQRREIGVTKTMVLNNIISTAHEPVSYLAPGTKTRLYQVFDYNWIGGTRRPEPGLPEWFGPDNINAAGRQLWSPGQWDNFQPPPEVQGKGIDLSRSFSVQGKTFDPLPGMTPGYFSGSAPDLGAVQHR